MQMLNLQKLTNKKNNMKLKKSQILLIGSLLVFIGIVLVSWNTLMNLKNEVYSEMKIDIVTRDDSGNDVVSTVPVANNVSSLPADDPPKVQTEEVVDYNKYLGVLEIPKIGLKRGFYDVSSQYNNIEYNVSVVNGSTMPDIEKGNLILMAHSGDAYISYFAYLYMLNVGDKAYVTYNNEKYKYQVVNIYDVPKVGKVTINRNYGKTTLTLITCTKDNDSSQTVYILEQV